MRPDLDSYMLQLASVAAGRTTCIRRGVGCVLADARGRVLAIAYNGVASGQPHCNEHGSWEGLGGGYLGLYPLPPEHRPPDYPHACRGYDLPPGLDGCEAVHAEQNALVQCRDAMAVDTAYVTLSPCRACAKLLLGTSCRRLVFGEAHSNLEGLELWHKAGRTYTQLPGRETVQPGLPQGSSDYSI